ncbi:S1 family peptidase [Marinicella sediminis]|uniref:S1 family peptidase n=1 Tax=Marinicella sediminis TaxID=1792834 RepID=A0ABV7JFA5_9GAMM|nr:S1 family peptidase [Marinicella sediminis]
MKRNHLEQTQQRSIIRHHLRLALSLTLLSGAGLADEAHLHDAATRISNDMAVFEDTRLLAKERGVNIKDVRQALAFQDQFASYFAELLEKYPNQIARVWLEPAPYQDAHIQFVGKAPAIQAPANVNLFGGGSYSMQEQQERAALLSKLLRANNHSNFLTYFDQQSGQIKLEMKTSRAAKAMSLTDLSDTLSAGFNGLDMDDNRLAKSLSINDIDYEVIIGEGEIYDFDYARGGEWLTDDGGKECTSGWAVSGPNGNGIITAAHCTGLNGLDHHYTTSDPTMTFRSQERGNGDVEYHTTSHSEVAEYYAREDEVRDVTGIKWTILMLPGQSVCEYGRSDNVRSCNHDVIATGVTTTFTDGVTVSNLVRVSGDDSIGGDSGGPWSWGTVAWGVHSGSNGSTSVFTPVQRAQSELNVTILTQ